MKIMPTIDLCMIVVYIPRTLDLKSKNYYVLEWINWIPNVYSWKVSKVWHHSLKQTQIQISLMPIQEIKRIIDTVNLLEIIMTTKEHRKHNSAITLKQLIS